MIPALVEPAFRDPSDCSTATDPERSDTTLQHVLEHQRPQGSESAVCSVQCAVCSMQCAVCSVQCAVCISTGATRWPNEVRRECAHGTGA